MKVSDRLKVLVVILSAGIVVVSGLYINLKMQETSITNEKLKLILESTLPESGLEIYDTLKLIECTIHPIEVYPPHCDIALTDYSAFLIKAKESVVEMGQVFSSEWNPSVLTWEENIWIITQTPDGSVVWKITFTSNEFITGLTNKERFRNMIARRLEILNERRLFDIVEFNLSRREAVTLGVYFLDDIGYETGKLVSAELEVKDPNFYWHELANLEKPDIQEERLCRVVKLTRAGYYPTEVLEIWVDDYTGEVIGGGGPAEGVM